MSVIGIGSPGVYSNEKDYSIRAARATSSIGAIVGAARKGAVNSTVLVTDTTELRAVFGTKHPKYGFMMYCAEMFLKQGKNLYVTRLVNNALTAGAFVTIDDPDVLNPNIVITNFDDGTNNPLGVDDPINNIEFTLGSADIDTTLFMVAAANPGEWNNNLSVRIRPSNPRGLPVGQDHDPFHFYVDVYENYSSLRSTPVETFLVSRREGEIDGYGQSLFIEEVINSRSSYIRVKNNPYCSEYAVTMTAFEFLAGGTDGDAITDDQIVEAWNLYEDPEEIDVNLLINGGYTNPIVQRAMDDLASRRADCFAILDMPYNAFEVATAVNYRREILNINSSYSGLYGPWVQIYDTDTGKRMWVPLSGFVGAAFAYTDRVRGLWFAAAGLSRGGVTVLAVQKKYNKGQRDALDRADINYVRFLPGKGYYIYNQATLQSFASAFSNVNVRRLVNYIKKGVALASMSGLFEQNDKFLRMELYSIADGYLSPIKQGRGVYEYEIVCDERNNPDEVVASGDCILDVIVDPTIPVKRLHLTAHIQPNRSVSFTEN